MKRLDYNKNIRKRIAGDKTLETERDDSSIATGVARRFHAESFARFLGECLSDDCYQEPGPFWLKEVQGELAAGRCSPLSQLRIRGLRYALDCQKAGKPVGERKLRHPSLATLKWRANAKAFDEMTQKRPLLPPHRRNK